MNNIQISALGLVGPHEKYYIEDVNKRIGEMENGIAALKNELKKQDLNEWE
jgi:hypothetical protein